MRISDWSSDVCSSDLGTGLGLSQVYGFTRSSGGDVQVESEPGKGATISLLLPRTLKSPPDSELVQRRDVAAHRNGRILLVEDDDQVAAMIREMQIGRAHV